MLVQAITHLVGDEVFLRVADIVALRHKTTERIIHDRHPRTGDVIEHKVAEEAFMARTRDGAEHPITEEDFQLLVRSWGMLRDQQQKVAALEAFLAKNAPTPVPTTRTAEVRTVSEDATPAAPEPYNDEHGDSKPASE